MRCVAARAGCALLMLAAGLACAGGDEAPGTAPQAATSAGSQSAEDATRAVAQAAPHGEPQAAPASATATPDKIVRSDMDFHRKRLHLRSAGSESGQAVLLLHGQAFDSATWEQLGTLTYLAEHGLRAVAIDAPGYGKSEAVDIQREALLEELVPALGLERPVIVAPSMGALYAFPYAVAHPEGVAGLVPVAPAGLDEWLPKLRDCAVPALIVWGSADTVVPVARADELAAALKNSRTLILKGAPHPAYLERPAEFHEALVEFARSVAR